MGKKRGMNFKIKESKIKLINVVYLCVFLGCFNIFKGYWIVYVFILRVSLEDIVFIELNIMIFVFF